MKNGSKLYVRIDYKVGEKVITHQDLQDHLDYVKNVASKQYFMGGVFSNATEGMCLFEAENLEEAQKITQCDPIIERGLYRSEIFEWVLVVLSEQAKEWFSENNAT